MKERGFTLLELLVALAISGILASIVIPLYMSYVDRSRERVADTNLQTLLLAEEAYFYDHNTYLAGTYDAANTVDTLNSPPAPSAPLGWRPDLDGNEFLYTVGPCGAGTIATCYTLTISRHDGKITPRTITRD